VQPGKLRKKKTRHRYVYVLFFFFFKLPFPFLAIRLFTVPFGRPLFPLQFPFAFSQVMRRGSGALSPATHAHSTSHSQTYTTTFIHPWAPFPDGTRTRADLAVVAERVLIFLPPPYRQPLLDIHTHGPAEVPSFEKILPLRWDSNPLASGPRPRSTFSDSHAATEPPYLCLVDLLLK
jgi:hypothetical protein